MSKQIQLGDDKCDDRNGLFAKRPQRGEVTSLSKAETWCYKGFPFVFFLPQNYEEKKNAIGKCLT